MFWLNLFTRLEVVWLASYSNSNSSIAGDIFRQSEKGRCSQGSSSEIWYWNTPVFLIHLSSSCCHFPHFFKHFLHSFCSLCTLMLMYWINLSSKVLSSVLNTILILLYSVILQVYLLHILSLTWLIFLHHHINNELCGCIHPTDAQGRCISITKSPCGVKTWSWTWSAQTINLQQSTLHWLFNSNAWSTFKWLTWCTLHGSTLLVISL